MPNRNHFHAVHYRIIADRLAQSRRAITDINGLTGIAVVTQLLADEFELDNPRFDRERFLAASEGRPTNKRDVIDG